MCAVVRLPKARRRKSQGRLVSRIHRREQERKHSHGSSRGGGERPVVPRPSAVHFELGSGRQLRQQAFFEAEKGAGEQEKGRHEDPTALGPHALGAGAKPVPDFVDRESDEQDEIEERRKWRSWEEFEASLGSDIFEYWAAPSPSF